MAKTVGLLYTMSSVSPEDGTIYGYDPSDLQSDIEIENGSISGELKLVTSGDLYDYWGEGYFLALEFGDGGTGTKSTKVGLIPSQGSGFVELDEDRNAASKIEDPQTQNFAVINSDGAHNYWQIFDLSELKFESDEEEQPPMTEE